MSFHRENIIWPSKNGTWNRGFFDFFPINTEGEDYDPEWDVEYDLSSFNWVRTGLLGVQAAQDCWDGANPGSFTIIEKYSGNAEKCQRLDQMAAALKQQGDRGRAQSLSVLPALEAMQRRQH